MQSHCPNTAASGSTWLTLSAAHPRRAGAATNTRRSTPSRLAALDEASTSLIPETLAELDSDSELLELHQRIASVGQAALTREERQRRQRSLDALSAPPFAAVCRDAGVTQLRRSAASILQLNIGLYCNQACRHCHVESSPRRTEVMSADVAARCVALLDASPSVRTLDLTGGAPELTPQFKYLVEQATMRGLEVIDRCNLTVLLEPGQEGLVQFLAEHHVRVVASLPCYSKENVDAQRGGGVFERSIRGLQMLNTAGYGLPGSSLALDLVYNPGGVFLAPPQSKLEATYRDELREAYGIQFTSLLCLNNMPIKRWADELVRRGQLGEYMGLLVGAFNPAAAEGVMCRGTASVGWDGRLYDCDFNQQLELGLTGGAGLSVFDVESLDELTGRPIAVDSHCFGCTAGAGSSCQGAVAG